MKATLSFNLPEDEYSFKLACRAQEFHSKLEDVWGELFRPAFKHGYSGLHAVELNQLLEGDSELSETAHRVIELLSERYQDLMGREEEEL